MAYQISLGTDVACYGLLDGGKIFINKDISAYVDFTDKSTLQGTDVAAKFNTQSLDAKAVVLPIFSQIERIGDTALCGRNLQHAKFPGLLSIDAYGLQENNILEHIELDSIKQIGRGGFLDCKNLQTVKIGNAIEEIAEDAFKKSNPFDEQSIQDLTIDRLSTEVRGSESGFGLDDRTVIHFKDPGPQPIPEITAFLKIANGASKFTLSNDGLAYWNQNISAVVDFTGLSAIRPEDVEYRVIDQSNKFVPIFDENLSTIFPAAFTACKFYNFKFSNALTSIGDAAFSECSGLTVADLTYAKTIGNYAFQGSDIPEIKFGQSIESIGELAFDDCNKLSTAIFTNDIQNIGENAFPAQTSAYFTQYKQVLRTYPNYPWGLTEQNIFAPKIVNLPSCLVLSQENITKDIVERQAFLSYTDISALTKLIIQKQCQTIASDAFSTCNNVTSAFFAGRDIEEVYDMGDVPFGLRSLDCIYPEIEITNLSTLVLNAATVDKDAIDSALHSQDLEKNQVLSILFTTTCNKIEYDDFSSFDNLIFATIPSSVEYVGRATFHGCNALMLSFIDKTWEQMQAMSGYPFGLPTAQLRATTTKPRINSSLKLATDVTCCKIAKDGKIFTKASECAVIDGTVEVVTKDLVDQKLQDIALNRSTNFKVIACLSSSTTQLDDESFAGLSNLYYVDFVDGHNNLTCIEKNSFKDCNVISSIVFEAWNMHDIAICSAYPFGLFNDMCLSSTDMADVTVIDHNVNSSQHMPGLSGCSFALLRKGCEYVDGSSDRHDYYFSNNSNLSTVICKYPCQIYTSAFYNCSSITEIDFPEVEYIRSHAFYNDTALRTEDSWPLLSSIKLPKCKNIGNWAFYHNPNIQELDLPEVESIGENAFRNELEYSNNQSQLTYGKSSKLRKVNAPKCKQLNDLAFHNCVNLTNINMPELETLGQDSFSLDFQFDSSYYTYKDKPVLCEINLPKIEYLAPYAFYGQSALVNIDIPSLIGIAEKALGHTGLTSFNAGYLTLYPYALAEMNLISADLENATFEAENRSPAGYCMFQSNTKLSAVKMDNMTMFASFMFDNCRELSLVSFDKNKIVSHGSSVFGSQEEQIAPYAKSVKYLDFPNLTGSNDGYKFSCYRNLISANLPQMTSIREYDFAYLSNIMSVYMPNCTTIDSRAFYESGIEKFYIPRNVTSIARSADGYQTPFYHCHKLIDLSVQSGNNVYFSDIEGKHYPAIFKWINPSDQTQGYMLWVATASLSSLPDGLTQISEGDLEYMKSLTSIYIPTTLTGDLYHLRGLSALQEISVAYDNPRYTDMGGCNVLVERENMHLLAGCNSSRLCGDIEIIESGAFAERNTLTSLVCEEPSLSALKEIQTGAFDNCANLKHLKIACPTEGAVQIKVDYQAIKYNNAMLSLELANISSFATTSDRYHEPLVGCDGLEHIELDGISAVPEYLCQAKANLKSAKFNSIAEVKTNSFNNCYELSSASFGSELTAIRSSAFDGCSKLTGINEVDYSNIKIVESAAFRGTQLQKAEFSQLTSIDDYVFAGTQISSINMPLLKHIGSGTFSNCKFTDIDLPGVQSIDSGTFAENKLLSNVNLPNLTSIGISGYGAFGYCDKLLSIELPQLKAFAGLQYSSILCIVAPEATSIENCAFQNCSNLICVDVSQVTSIGDNAFERCIALSSVVLPNATTIGNRVFTDCSSISEIKLPSISSIYSNNFRGCSALTSLEFEKLKEASYDAFSYTSLREITLPSTLTCLNMNAFNQSYSSWDDRKQSWYIYSYETLCPDLSMVWFKGRSYDKVISEINREDSNYYYAKDVPYWGIDRKYIKIDNKYMSILKLATGTKRYDLADGGIVYSNIPILDLTDTTRYNLH